MSGERRVATKERQQFNFEKNVKANTYYSIILLNLIHISIL